MAFSPHLSPEQYAELVKLSEDAPNRDELREMVRKWAQDNGLRMTFDESRALPDSSA